MRRLNRACSLATLSSRPSARWLRGAAAAGLGLSLVAAGCGPAAAPSPPPPAPILPAVAAPAAAPIPARPREMPGFTGCFEPRRGPKRMTISDGLLLDVDRDGTRDLVVLGAKTGRQYEESLFVLSGDRAGDFAVQSRQRVPAGWLGLVIADFNGDGKPDLAADDYERGTVDVRLGTQDGGYGSARVHPVGEKAGQLASGDFDGDGRLDLAVPLASEVKLLRGTGTGSFVGLQSLPTGKYPARPVVADFNQDGRPDVAVASNDSHKLHVFLHDGKRLEHAGDYACGKGGAPLAVGDFDGDGFDDVAMGNMNSHTTCVFRGDGHGKLRLGEELADGGWSAGAADLDHDGHAELVVSSALPRRGNRLGPWGALSVYRFEEGRMVLKAKLDTLAPAERFWVHDVDGDSTHDVITISQSGVMVLLGRPCPNGGP